MKWPWARISVRLTRPSRVDPQPEPVGGTSERSVEREDGGVHPVDVSIADDARVDDAVGHVIPDERRHGEG